MQVLIFLHKKPPQKRRLKNIKNYFSVIVPFLAIVQSVQ